MKCKLSALARLLSNAFDLPFVFIALPDTGRHWTYADDRRPLPASTSTSEQFVQSVLATPSVRSVRLEGAQDYELFEHPGMVFSEAPQWPGYLATFSCGQDLIPAVIGMFGPDTPRFDRAQIDSLTTLVALIRHDIPTVAGREASAGIEKYAVYKAAFDQAALGIAVVGLDGTWLETNDAICAMLGRTPGELATLSFQQLTHPDDLEADLDMAEQILSGRKTQYSLEKRYLRPDGSAFWGNLTVKLVRDERGQPRFFVSIIEDITARKATEEAFAELRSSLERRVLERTTELGRTTAELEQALERIQISEEALADKEADLRAVLANAHDGYISTDHEGKVIDWNRRAESMFGWTRDEAVGRPIEELIIPHHMRPAHRTHMLQPTGTSSRMLERPIELPAVHRNGKGFHCEVSITKLHSMRGGVMYAAFLRDISERRAREQQIREANASLKDLYDNAPTGYYSLDGDGLFLQLNDKSLELLETTRDEVIGKLGPYDFFTSEGARRFHENYPIFKAVGHFGPQEFDVVARSGQMKRISVAATALRDESGAFVRSRSVMFDVTELHQTRLALQAANKQQKLMLDNELYAIFKVRNRRITWANKALERMLGYSAAELEGTSTRALYASQVQYDKMGLEAYPVLKDGRNYRTQLELLHRTGRTIWVDMSGAELNKETGESLWMMLDISAMKKYQAEVETLAYHDSLTGLPNRMLLMDRLGLALAHAKRSSESLAVCFGDLNGFKKVNDQHGHDAGDFLLCEVAQRLAQTVREHDTIARLGGDEFVIVLTKIESKACALDILERVSRSVSSPICLPNGTRVNVGISFGVAFTEDSLQASELIALADERMYMQKRACRKPA